MNSKQHGRIIDNINDNLEIIDIINDLDKSLIIERLCKSVNEEKGSAREECDIYRSNSAY